MPSLARKRAHAIAHFPELEAKVNGVDGSLKTVITRALSDISRAELKHVDEVRVRIANAQHEMATTIADVTAERPANENIAVAVATTAA